MRKFNVYDKVWVMEYNKPKEKRIATIIETSNYLKNGVDYRYHLVNSFIGYIFDFNNDYKKCYDEDNIFSSKEELMKELGSK